MASFLDKFKSAYESAYWMQPFRNVSIYPKILETKTKFSEEEKTALIKKRWYIYYDYINPETGKYKRQTPITVGLNREFRNFDDRLAAFKKAKEQWIEYLKAGNSPYKKKAPGKFTAISALDFALEEKKSSNIGERTAKGYKKSVNALQEWFKKTGKANTPITDITPQILTQFISSIKASNRTKNNYRSDLSAIFTVLFKQGYINSNPFEQVDKERSEQIPDPTYSDKQVEEITGYLKKNDPILLMYVYFVSFMFWRPKENCRLKVKDINLEERKMSTATKTKSSKTKIIPDILYNDLLDYLKDAKPEDLVFTPTGPGEWGTALDNRRDYFSKRYRKVKEELNLDSKYTIYSFRHSFITRAYKNILAEVKSEDKAISILSKITGHTSKAVFNYIHYLDISLPKDYSKYLK